MKPLFRLGLVALLFWLAPSLAQAQPSRMIPGTRPMLPGSPPFTGMEPNSRVKPAISGVGLESTDFYGKKGYPRVIGDAVETTTTSSSGSTAAGNTGGVGGGNQGSTGGAGGGGSLGGSLGALGGGGVSGGSLGLTNPGNPGITGGGFSGLVPKGFGFGGTPTFSHSWLAPLSGGPVR